MTCERRKGEILERQKEKLSRTAEEKEERQTKRI
jgi:hypothetical protein